MPQGHVIKIGLETDFLNRAMTGVGNYCFHLLGALMDDHQDFQFSAFSGMTWNAFGPENLRHFDRVHGKGASDGDSSTPDMSQLQKLQHTARLAASRIEFARRVYRGIRMTQFRKGGTLATLDMFHAFKYLPPVDLDVPVLPVVYDLSFVRFPETHPRERLKELERLPDVVARAPFVHTISEFSKGEIARVYGYPSERIIVAPPAASAIFRPLGEDAARKDIATLDLVPGSYFLAVGTLEPRKNLRTLIAAYAALSPEARNRFPLVIAGGSGWGKIELPSAADRLMSDGSLRFLGAVSDAMLRSLYEGTRALLFPSIYEGFGMPAVEALACGAEVIHSSGTSMDEITEGSSRTVPAMDVSAWTDAMKDLLDTPVADQAERDLMIARAQKFDWHRSAEAVSQLYRQIASHRN